MFKKLLIITALYAGFAVNPMHAMETESVASQGSTLQWLKHFGVACLVYNVIGAVERKAMDALFPMTIPAEAEEVANMQTMAALEGDEEIEQPRPKLHGRNVAIRAVAAIATLYGCYKLTNYLHQQMSPEAYRWAHFLGAIF